MKVYRSEISKGILFFICTIVGINIILMLLLKSWAGLAILLLLALFIFHIFRNTFYTIAGSQLHIKSGVVYNSVIEISHIKKINRTNNILSAPSLSFDRIEIHYNKFDTVIISPERREEFIDDLKKINPGIVTNL